MSEDNDEENEIKTEKSAPSDDLKEFSKAKDKRHKVQEFSFRNVDKNDDTLDKKSMHSLNYHADLFHGTENYSNIDSNKYSSEHPKVKRNDDKSCKVQSNSRDQRIKDGNAADLIRKSSIDNFLRDSLNIHQINNYEVKFPKHINVSNLNDNTHPLLVVSNSIPDISAIQMMNHQFQQLCFFKLDKMKHDYPNKSSLEYSSAPVPLLIDPDANINRNSKLSSNKEKVFCESDYSIAPYPIPILLSSEEYESFDESSKRSSSTLALSLIPEVSSSTNSSNSSTWNSLKKDSGLIYGEPVYFHDKVPKPIPVSLCYTLTGNCKETCFGNSDLVSISSEGTLVGSSEDLTATIGSKNESSQASSYIDFRPVYKNPSKFDGRRQNLIFKGKFFLYVFILFEIYINIDFFKYFFWIDVSDSKNISIKRFSPTCVWRSLSLSELTPIILLWGELT